MNYTNIYNKLISRAQNRTLEGYKEKHHIIPRCLGGTDDPTNLVDLTPEEHYVAHQLLVKMHPDSDKLIFAIVIMSGKNPTTNKLFGWHRRKLAETQAKIKTGVKRGPMSAEHKAAIGAANSGANNGMYGKKWTEEQREKLKNRVPWNKGKKTGVATEGSFKKGSTPWNKGKTLGEPWNKGLTKDTDPRVAQYGKTRSSNNKNKDIDTQ